MRLVRFAITLLTALTGFLPGAVAANDVDTLLATDGAPAGVVFEIVSGDEDTLDRLLPGVRADIERLHARFPGLPVAVGSHGEELFALTTAHRAA